MKKLNLNDSVKVKLTPLGAEIYFHQFDDLNKVLSSKGAKPVTPHMPKIDEDGYTLFQLWDFIHLYGEYINIGKQNVIIDMNFYIPDNNLTEAETE